MFKFNYAASNRDVYSTYQFRNVINLERPLSWFNVNGNFANFVDESKK
jgi:hypothetical protein